MQLNFNLKAAVSYKPAAHFALVMKWAFFLFCIYFFLSSCRTQKVSQATSNKEYTLKAILYCLENYDQILPTEHGPHKIKVDPVIRDRPVTMANGKQYFTNPMYSCEIIPGVKSKPFKINPADKRFAAYQLAIDTTDFEFDYAMSFQFTPLYSTVEKDVYLLGVYAWTNACTDNSCMRCLLRDYLVFQIKDNEIHFIKLTNIEEGEDMICFGGFSKKRMMKSKPGEKWIPARYLPKD